MPEVAPRRRTLVVWRLDRLGRRLTDLVHIVSGCEQRKIQFESRTEESKPGHLQAGWSSMYSETTCIAFAFLANGIFNCPRLRIDSPILLPVRVRCLLKMLPVNNGVADEEAVEPGDTKRVSRSSKERYQGAKLATKTAILGEFVEVTGYHRKHAIRLLGPSSGRK